MLVAVDFSCSLW